MDDPPADELRDHGTDTHRDRCNDLLDAAQDHVRNRRPERAKAIWRQLMVEGGKGSDDARREYADYICRRLLDDDEQSRLQAALADDDGISRLTWLRAGALLERRGQLVDALIWYSSATDHTTADTVDSSRWAKLMVTGRRRVKWAMGMELDRIDLLGDPGDIEVADRHFDLLDLLRDPVMVGSRVQVWSRAEFADALKHWPGRITEGSVDAYYREVEGRLRECDRPVTIVRQTSTSLLDCIEALERPLADPPQDEIPGVPWPPERNQACWCGSDKKYKKCCGMGGLPSGARQAWGPAGLRSGAQLAVCRV